MVARIALDNNNFNFLVDLAYLDFHKENCQVSPNLTDCRLANGFGVERCNPHY